MDQKQILKVALPLIAVAVMVLLFFLMGRLMGGGAKPPGVEPDTAAASQAVQTPVPVAGGVAPGLVAIAPAAASGNQVAEKLRAAKAEVDKAVRAMAGASKANHGGFVEQAQAALDQTARDAAEALAFAEAHPELSDLPGAATAEALAAADHTRNYTITTPGGQGHLVDGLSALQSALAALQEARGGNIGGNREKLIGDIDRSATAIMDGFDYLRNGPGARQPARRGTMGGTPAPGPAPGPTLAPPTTGPATRLEGMSFGAAPGI